MSDKEETTTVQTSFTIDKFDHKITKWNRWIQRLEGAFAVFNIKKANHLHFLLHYMGQEAFDIVYDKLAPTSAYTKTYDEIVKLLEMHYNPAPLEIMENYRFHLRIQKEGETIQEFLTGLRRLAINCNFGDYLKIALRNQFVFGLRSERIQGRLLESRTLDLEKAVELATALELSSRDAAQLHRHPNTVNFVNSNEGKKNQKFNNKNNKGNGSSTSGKNSNTNQNKNIISSSMQNKLSCYRCGLKTHLANNCVHVKSTCEFCKKVGHLVSVCTKLKQTKHTNLIEIDSNSDKPVVKVNDLEIFKIENGNVDYSKVWLDIKVNALEIKFEVDTGSPVSIMSLKEKSKFFPELEILSTDVGLVTYCGNSLDVVGVIDVSVKDGGIDIRLPLYIVKTNRHALLGREWMRKLSCDWNKILNVETVSTISAKVHDIRVTNLLNKFDLVFSDTIGKIEGMQAKLNLKEGCIPVFYKARQIPFAIKSVVESEIDSLVQNGVLEKVSHSEWATPLVPVMKSNGTVRLCGDFKITVNPNLIIDDHPLPTIEELFASMSGGSKFTKIDLKNAYLQMEVRPEDRSILTLNTHKGLFRPTRLMYGIASAPALWQRQMEIILQDIEGVSVFLDDIKITGPDDQTHLKRLELVLSRLQKHNMRVNLKKCEFFADSIEYCGYKIDRNGIHKLQSKMDAIQNMKRPSNVSEVRAFVGLINYYGRFFENLSTNLYPINNLLKKETKFVWDDECENAFRVVKGKMQEKNFLAHYDPKRPLVLATDASSYGVGAVLSHTYPDGSERPLQYASQTLSATQQKYTQIDKEAYAIIFGVQKFSQFLVGRKFTLLVDNKPLIQILSPHKGLPTFSAMRMQHYELLLRGFHYDIKYRNTKQHGNADAMSRLPVKNIPDFQYEGVDVLGINLIETLPLRVQDLSEITMKDKSLSTLIHGLRTGRQVPSNNRFGIDQIEFSLQEGCLMRGMRVFIPLQLRKIVLDELHSTHFGISRMKSLARSYCWWDGMDQDIEVLAKNCSKCQIIQANPVKVPLHCWETATKPFQRVHADFAGPFMGIYFFVLVDAYTKWPEVHILRNLTSEKTIKVCRSIFSCFGIPSVLVTDHGSQFTGGDFQNFLKMNGIVHKMGAPYHPATNGQAERYVRTIKEKLKALDCDREEIHFHLANILLTYRKTIHPSTGKTPAMMMFNREIRSRMDLMLPSEKNSQNNSLSGKVRHFKIGARVAAREYLSRQIKWRFGYISKKMGELHYLVVLDDNRIWKRHVDQIREVGSHTTDLELNLNVPLESEDSINDDIKSQTSGTQDKNNSACPDQMQGRCDRSSVGRENVFGRENETKANIVADTVIESHTVEDKLRNENSIVRRSTRIRKPVERLDL